VDQAHSDFAIIEQVAPARRAPSSAQRARAIGFMTLAFWGLNFGIFTVSVTLDHVAGLVPLMALRALFVVFGMAVCFAIYVLQGRAGGAVGSRVLITLSVAPFASLLCAGVWIAAAPLAGHQVFNHTPNSAEIFKLIARWVWFFLGWGGLCMAVEYYFDARDEEMRALEFRTLAQHAKLAALHNQINPHFLFNSLNSISALIVDRRIDDADRIIDLLARYFRKTMAIDPMSDSTLGEEVRLNLEYLSIEQARYPDLAVDVDLAPAAEDARVPALLLQPLIENAVKHGVAQSSAPAHVIISAHEEADTLIVLIENTCEPVSVKPNGAGIGMRNVRERLENRYGVRQHVSVRASPYSHLVEIRMPLVRSA
jgi:hypothetical protein